MTPDPIDPVVVSLTQEVERLRASLTRRYRLYPEFDAHLLRLERLIAELRPVGARIAQSMKSRR